jgi:hypothetical protein
MVTFVWWRSLLKSKKRGEKSWGFCDSRIRWSLCTACELVSTGQVSAWENIVCVHMCVCLWVCVVCGMCVYVWPCARIILKRRFWLVEWLIRKLLEGSGIEYSNSH